MNVHSKPTTPTVINGINVDDVQAVIAAVQANPANGATKWKVKNTWQGQTVSKAEVESCHIGGTEVPRRFTFQVDEPVELGGTNQHANPQEYLLAALNACMTVGYVALCALNGITLEKVEIETTGDIDLRGFLGLDDTVPAGYEKLETVVRIKGDATRAQFEQIHKMVKATSPNLYNVTRAVSVNPTLVVE
jgi:uncharacterized OsmC-like protein